MNTSFQGVSSHSSKTIVIPFIKLAFIKQSQSLIKVRKNLSIDLVQCRTRKISLQLRTCYQWNCFCGTITSLISWSIEVYQLKISISSQCIGFTQNLIDFRSGSIVFQRVIYNIVRIENCLIKSNVRKILRTREWRSLTPSENRLQTFVGRSCFYFIGFQVC